MNKSKMKHFNFLSKSQNRYSIRRFSAGIASVLVGTAFFLGTHTSDASAAEQDKVPRTTQTSQNSSNISDSSTAKTVKGPQMTEQSTEAKPTEISTNNNTANSTEALAKEETQNAQTTDLQQNENQNIQQTATPKNPKEDTPTSKEVAKKEKNITESSSSEKSTSETPTHQLELPSTEIPTNQTQFNIKQPQTTEQPPHTEQQHEKLLKETNPDNIGPTTKALYLEHLKDGENKEDTFKTATTVSERNKPEKIATPKKITWRTDVVPEDKAEILADAIANGYIKSGIDATNAAHTLSGRAWLLDHGTPATMMNGLTPVPEGTKVHLQWIDKDGATSPIYIAKTTNRLSSIDGSQVGRGAYAFDLRKGWTDANGKHHVYSAVKGQRYKIWIDDFTTKDGNIATMLRVAGGYLPGTYVDSVTYNNMGQFPLIGTNMQRTGIFMTTLPSEKYLTSKHHVIDSIGATANPAVTMIEDDFVSGRIWVETGAGDYANSATGPNYNMKDVDAAGYKVVMTSLTDQGAKAYDAEVNRLPEKDRAEAAHKLLTAHPEYMSVTVEGVANERGEYTLRFPTGTLNKDHLYGYVLNRDGKIVKTYSGFTSAQFRRPNYNLSVTPQTAPYYRPIRHAWVNVNFAVVETIQTQINIKNFDVTSNPAHRGQTAYVDITGMPKTLLPTRVQWKDSSGRIVKDSGIVTTKKAAESKSRFMIPTSTKSGEVYTVQLVVGDHTIASDSLIVHVNEDAAKYHLVYPSTTVEAGQKVTVPAPKDANDHRLPNGTTFEKGHHVPQWVTVNRDGSIIVKPGEKVTKGDYDIPVIVTYQDGSKNTIFASVTVQEKALMASQYEPISEGIKKPFGTPVTSTDVTSSIKVPGFPVKGEQPTVTVDDETKLPNGKVEGQKDVDVTVTYPDGTKDHIKVPVVTEKQLDGDKYDPVATGILKHFGDPTTEEDVTKLVEVPNYPTDLPQPKVTVTNPSTLPDGQTPGKVDVDVTVTYPDGSTDHILVPVWTNKHLDKDKYEPTSEGVTKPFGTPVTSTDVTNSIKVPDFPVKGEQPTVTVDDETKLPNGKVEGRMDVDVTVTYPDGTKDHIKVPVVTEKQPDNEKYEPTTIGITKAYGTPTTAVEVKDTVQIPYFPVDGKQPVVTVNDPRQLPSGKKEGQINVAVTVTYPDGTKDYMTVPVVTGKQAENEKYDPITLGIHKAYGHPTTSTDVTDSIQIPNFPVEGEQPVVTVDDETKLPDGQTVGEVDIPVTVTYPDGTQDHITIPVFTSQQRDNQKYEPSSHGVTKDYGISTGVDDVLDAVEVPGYPADLEEQPTKTVDAPDQLPDGMTEGRVTVGVTVTYPDGSKDHIKVPVVINPPADNVRYEPTTNGVTKSFGEPTTADDVTGAVKVPNFPTDGEQPVVTVIDPKQLPNGKKEGQINVGVTVTYPDGTADAFTVPVVTNKQPDNDKYEPTTNGITKPYGIPTKEAEVLDAVNISNYPQDAKPPVLAVKDPTQLPSGRVVATVDVDVIVTYPDGTTDEISVPVTTSSPGHESGGHGSSSASGVSEPGSNGPIVSTSIKLPPLPGFLPHLIGPHIASTDENHQQPDSDKYNPTSEGVTKAQDVSITKTDVADSVKNPGHLTGDIVKLGDDVTYPDGPTTELTVPVTVGNQQVIQVKSENPNSVKSTVTTATHATTAMTSATNGVQEATDVATTLMTPYVETNQPTSISTQVTAKEVVKQLPETGENKKQADVLLGGLIAVMGGLLIFGRRRNEKKN